MPDGSNDIPVDRMAARQRLEQALNAVLVEKFDRSQLIDAAESKLFRIGVDAMTVGSHEFYLCYAIRRKIVLCLDMGHFHPMENIADKLSAVGLSVPQILLHVPRLMRWDSDHVILLSDEILQMAQELVFTNLLELTHIGLDFFDATISRTSAWVVGVRNMQKALLEALLLPQKKLTLLEHNLDFTGRLILTEELRDLPFSVVWNEFRSRQNVPMGAQLMDSLTAYQSSVSWRDG